jgi:hypothetical protein
MLLLHGTKIKLLLETLRSLFSPLEVIDKQF